LTEIDVGSYMNKKIIYDEGQLIELRSRYGDLLTLKEIAEVFRYPTVGAVRKANSRGTLPVKLYRFPNKNGFYAKVREVADSISCMKQS
jgi:hypothetical protein